MRLPCSKCQGEGNDPWDAACEGCGGGGSQGCEIRGCKEQAVGFDEDGRALCEDCMCEWACNYGDDEVADGWLSDGSWKP